jgi:hypothetical protein
MRSLAAALVRCPFDDRHRRRCETTLAELGDLRPFLLRLQPRSIRQEEKQY